VNDSALTNSRLEQIRQAIDSSLNTEFLEITDESHLHAGHAGARTGMGHFHVKIVAQQFVGQSLIKRHRLVYAAVGDLMETDIHALGIEAFAPGERVD
jgi:BolA protein